MRSLPVVDGGRMDREKEEEEAIVFRDSFIFRMSGSGFSAAGLQSKSIRQPTGLEKEGGGGKRRKRRILFFRRRNLLGRD
jgi:hypothetical protein